jgi:hypothetical protein
MKVRSKWFFLSSSPGLLMGHFLLTFSVSAGRYLGIEKPHFLCVKFSHFKTVQQILIECLLSVTV